jgi:hypothetical protein
MFASQGQSVVGTSGLIHIPSARIMEDGQFVLGAALIPKGYFRRTYGPNREEFKINPGVNTYITYAILPFVEVMFRYTHELNVPVNMETKYFPDRMLGFRLRILNETKKRPAIVLGLQDASAIFGSTSQGSTNFSAPYFVFSKKTSTSYGEFDWSIGYAFDFFSVIAKDFKGIFGGVMFTPQALDKLSFVFENNSKGFNTGFKINPIEPINLMFGLWDLKKPTISINYVFY